MLKKIRQKNDFREIGHCFLIRFHLTEKSRTESGTRIGAVKKMDMTPEAIAAEPAFRDETVDMRVPFEISAESM